MPFVAWKCFETGGSHEAFVYLADQVLYETLVKAKKAALLQIYAYLLRIRPPCIPNARIFCGIPFDVYADRSLSAVCCGRV